MTEVKDVSEKDRIYFMGIIKSFPLVFPLEARIRFFIVNTARVPIGYKEKKVNYDIPVRWGSGKLGTTWILKFIHQTWVKPFKVIFLVSNVIFHQGNAKNLSLWYLPPIYYNVLIKCETQHLYALSTRRRFGIIIIDHQTIRPANYSKL